MIRFCLGALLATRKALFVTGAGARKLRSQQRLNLVHSSPSEDVQWLAVSLVPGEQWFGSKRSCYAIPTIALVG